MLDPIVHQVGEFIAEAHTIEEASIKFSRSTSSIKKYLAKIRDKESPYYNEILAEKIRLAQAKVELAGRKKGGQKGRRGRTWPMESCRLFAEIYIQMGLSIERLSLLIGIPKSTFYELIRSVPDLELQARIDDAIAVREPEIVQEKELLWKQK